MVGDNPCTEGLKALKKTPHPTQVTKEEKSQLQSDMYQMEFYSGWRRLQSPGSLSHSF